MMKYLAKRKKEVAIFCCALFLFQIAQPTVTMALTGGPSQPEVQGFQEAGTTEMVDLFSGDFSYNIPLFELPGPNGGYPFNLSYQAGVGMDQEASWVGLGWSLNPGAITRQMRGLPDEFKGDLVKTKMAVSPSVTLGLGAGVSTEIFGADGISLSVGFSVSHNSYKGLGYSLDGSLGFARAVGGGMTGGIGLDLSLDSKEGVSMQPSLSLNGKTGGVGLSAGYNSKTGLSNIGFFQSNSYPLKGKGRKDECGTRQDRSDLGKAKFSSSASLSLASPSYTPQVMMPMKNLNLSAEFKPGASWWAITPDLYVRGFYNEQHLDNNKQVVSTAAYGYMNYQYAANDPKALLDFNREKDGMVSKESPNLAIPALSYDIYSAQGQGISAMYRPMRNDHGIIYDQQTSSISNGGAVGVDVAPEVTHLGVNLSVNHSNSTSGAWTESNDLTNSAKFQQKKSNDLYEPWYFKVHGESDVQPASEVAQLGGDDAVRVRLEAPLGNSTAKAANGFENNSGLQFATPSDDTQNRDRKSRNQVIQPITNEQLLAGTTEILSQFRIKYLDANGNETTLARQGNKFQPHHIAGYTALTAEGMRYTYALPAYNLKQDEVTFSTQAPSVNTPLSSVNIEDGGGGTDGDPKYDYDGTDNFLKSVEMPAYTHSHLLTSIIGPDYVDLTNDGVTYDDLGYWVKFTYQKTTTDSDPYKWRDPFSKAHYQSGWVTDPRDDRGSFTYGEKELWYLARAETKTHIATFMLNAARQDALEVDSKLQLSTLTHQGQARQLDEIDLFTRSTDPNTPNATATLIKAVKLLYDGTTPLCQGLYNPGGPGKLTLKKVWFEYGGSARGSLNPYTFIYSNVNPSYDNLASDRWGNYKPYPLNEFDHNRDFPYVDQDPSHKADLDANASAWSLKEIDLPSGGKIIVDYETDDYGYVQHKQAMQMTEIVSPDGISPPPGNFLLKDDNLSVRFKLESPIAGTLTDAQQQAEVMKYLDLEEKQIYFKLKINLRTVQEGFYEYVSGYADINTNPTTMGLDKGDNGMYEYGHFAVNPEVGNDANFHPFSMRTWQHLRTNQPELANSGRKLQQTTNTGARIDQIKSLGSIGTQIRQMFGGFYLFCSGKHWGREIFAGKSWIRLYSPDKIKYGGGLRVRQITMQDQWSEDEEGTYGQVYEYTTKDDHGATISSGVAEYEPIIGGEENPLRRAKKYVQSVPLRADNNLYFEYPVNEGSYPGPHVGYRKITVWSLPAAYAAGVAVKNITLSNGSNLFPQGPNVQYGTTGKTEHEFYTAKDFPVMAQETDKTNKPFRMSIPVPFVGNVSFSNLTTSQGYSIVTNDMHGKPKKISNFRQASDGTVEEEPISWVQYNYLSEQKFYEKEKVNALLNTFTDNGDNTLSIATSGSNTNLVTIGQETELFTDMRQFQDKAWSGGARVNLDIMYIPIAFVLVPVPVPTAWPSIGKSENLLRTAVTNKIIFKSGILESTEAYDGGSRMITHNLKWDKLSGVPVVTTTNNNFDASVYSYSIFASSQYDGMGKAYKNIGLSFDITTVTKDPYKDGVYSFNTGLSDGTLYPGDEVIIYEQGSDLNKPLAKAVYTGVVDGDNLLYSQQQLQAKSFTCMIVRSGFRNQLSVSAGTISGLQDPSIPGTPKTYTKTVTIAK